MFRDHHQPLCWSVYADKGLQFREGAIPTSHSVADAGTSLDDRNEGKARQHGRVPEEGLGLAGLSPEQAEGGKSRRSKVTPENGFFLMRDVDCTHAYGAAPPLNPESFLWGTSDVVALHCFGIFFCLTETSCSL